ncbi:hypothetical protein YC2023_017260 [Brassica napus]
MYATQRSIMKIWFCGSDNNASGWREVSRDGQPETVKYSPVCNLQGHTASNHML